MSEHAWSWTGRTSFKSRRGAHEPFMREVLAELTKLGWSNSDLFGVEMALEESLSNAVRHGNGLDESKEVIAECKAAPDRFWLRVQDQGAGFKPHHVPDCTAEGLTPNDPIAGAGVTTPTRSATTLFTIGVPRPLARS